MNKATLVFSVVEQISKGKVATYGDIAKILDMSPRQVGKVLHSNPDPSKYPCHRVVRSDGRIATGYAFGGPKSQIKKLVGEEVDMQDGKIVDFNSIRINLKDLKF